ncbi:AraC family transcriptional regulator [Myroides sp. M-43]|uniref:helix-turn-helix domain-containing protein n=1 Tax=Myroides oncorhynchi TaxID=2893756 RepID=UPI001E2976CA|nr:AraC family transcriptional regulator [Myroides oncorhynchi]MCC9041288.1 AraC family transcriptional regulator [Myroides oncorhynchi]
MAKYLITSLLVCIVAISIGLLGQTFKNYNNKKAPSIFRQLMLIISCHAGVVLAGIYLLSDSLLLSNSSPFFLFYGLYFYLFVENISNHHTVINKTVYYSKQFLLPGFFASGFIFLALVSDKLTDEFIYSYFYVLFALEGVLTVYYSVRSYVLLINDTVIKETLRLHLMAINTLLLFIGILLLSFIFLDFSFILLYRLLICLCVVALVFYLAIVYKKLAELFDISTCRSTEKNSDFNFVNSTVLFNYSSTSEKLDVLESVPYDDEKEKYVKSRISEELLEKYRIRMNSILIVGKLYLNQDLSLDELSEVSKISKHHLGQYFSLVHHTNFNKFINQLRIEYIISYIHNHKEAKLSVNDLLALSPFKSRASFFRNFKDFTGSAPSDYLKTYYESIN